MGTSRSSCSPPGTAARTTPDHPGPVSAAQQAISGAEPVHVPVGSTFVLHQGRAIRRGGWPRSRSRSSISPRGAVSGASAMRKAPRQAVTLAFSGHRSGAEVPREPVGGFVDHALQQCADQGVHRGEKYATPAEPCRDRQAPQYATASSLSAMRRRPKGSRARHVPGRRCSYLEPPRPGARAPTGPPRVLPSRHRIDGRMSGHASSRYCRGAGVTVTRRAAWGRNSGGPATGRDLGQGRHFVGQRPDAIDSALTIRCGEVPGALRSCHRTGPKRIDLARRSSARPSRSFASTSASPRDRLDPHCDIMKVLSLLGTLPPVE